MKSPQFVGGVIAGCLLSLVCLLSLTLMRPQPAEARDNPKWEYAYVNGKLQSIFPFPDADTLNLHGKQGWEVVAPVGNGTVLLKRRR